MFIVGRVYGLLAMDKDTVEASVQEYWDSATSENRVRFELYTIGNVVAMSFRRESDYSSYNAGLTKDIMSADTFMMTAHEYKGFMMPVPFPILPVPRFGCPCHISRTDFLDACWKSVKIPRTSRIENTSLDIGPTSVILRIQIE